LFISPAYISHSASKENLGRIFKELLPPLDGKILLDIGSRLGAVLYGAYVFSTAQKIIGIELNQDMVSLSSEMVNKYGMKVILFLLGPQLIF
jgi:precorrin-6B methylase 2